MRATAYWMTGGLARYSDARETVINVVAAIDALVALWISEQPADANHPCRPHKAEYLSALVEGALVLATALLIGRARDGRPAARLKAARADAPARYQLEPDFFAADASTSRPWGETRYHSPPKWLTSCPAVDPAAWSPA